MPKVEVGPDLMSTDDRSVRLYRQTLLTQLCSDSSYSVFALMEEMTSFVSDYVVERLGRGGPCLVWAGGSLGRGEMLPNSDVDAFLIHRLDAVVTLEKPGVGGFHKFELGRLTEAMTRELLQNSLVDANRIIDGRPLCGDSAEHVVECIRDANTLDRQLANVVSEYYFWSYFDFPHKAGSQGANYKYSSGASRTTVFFNLVYRLGTGRFPFHNQLGPEIAHSLSHISSELRVRPPYRALEVVLMAKDVAASLFDWSDPRSRRASASSLEAVYEMCRGRFTGTSIVSSGDFFRCYYSARREVESAVNSAVARTLERYLGELRVKELATLGDNALICLCAGTASGSYHNWSRTETSLGAWLLAARNACKHVVESAAHRLMARPIADVWGGIMAIICARSTDDELLQVLLTWLEENERGAYLAKLITRSPAASTLTRKLARDLYLAREGIEQVRS